MTYEIDKTDSANEDPVTVDVTLAKGGTIVRVPVGNVRAILAGAASKIGLKVQIANDKLQTPAEIASKVKTRPHHS